MVEPDRWVVDANLHEVNVDGTDDWTGPVVATEFDAMYDYSPVTETYVYLKNWYRSPDPSQFSIGVTGPDDVEHVVVGPSGQLHGIPMTETFSPAGDQILYHAATPGGSTAPFIVNVDGSSPISLGAAGQAGTELFLPDGSQVVVLSGRATIINADGTGARIIFRQPVPHRWRDLVVARWRCDCGGERIRDRVLRSRGHHRPRGVRRRRMLRGARHRPTAARRYHRVGVVSGLVPGR